MKVVPVVTGFCVDVLASIVFAGILISIVGGDSAEESARRMASSVELQISRLLVGLAFTAIGGYVAALMARERELLHGAGVGALSLGFGLAVFAVDPIMPTDTVELVLLGVGMLLTIPAAAFGGWYRLLSERTAKA